MFTRKDWVSLAYILWKSMETMYRQCHISLTSTIGIVLFIIKIGLDSFQQTHVVYNNVSIHRKS